METFFSDKVDKYVITRSWRSVWWDLLCFILVSSASVSFTEDGGMLLIRNSFEIGGYLVEVRVPLLWIIAAFILVRALFMIYDAVFIITPHHLHCTTGILSLSKKFVEISYEDLMGVEVEQRIPGRILNYGDIEVGTAETPEHEICFVGVAHPHEFAKIISHQIDKARVERRVKPVEQILSEVEHQIASFKESAARDRAAA